MMFLCNIIDYPYPAPDLMERMCHRELEVNKQPGELQMFKNSEVEIFSSV